MKKITGKRKKGDCQFTETEGGVRSSQERGAHEDNQRAVRQSQPPEVNLGVKRPPCSRGERRNVCDGS